MDNQHCIQPLQAGKRLIYVHVSLLMSALRCVHTTSAELLLYVVLRWHAAAICLAYALGASMRCVSAEGFGSWRNHDGNAVSAWLSKARKVPGGRKTDGYNASRATYRAHAAGLTRPSRGRFVEMTFPSGLHSRFADNNLAVLISRVLGGR